MWIINTRPKERASPLSNALAQKGAQVFELPLLALTPLPLSERLSQQFIAFLQAEIVVVVSSIAANLGMQYYQALKLPVAELQKKRWIAVGRATQSTLHTYGITSECPDIETSEGMLQLPILQNVIEQKIAFWRGEGGRTVMIQHMQLQGITVLNMLLYTRAMPEYDHDLLTQLKQCLPAYVLISSEASWLNWQSLCARDDVLSDTFKQNIYIVLGQRVTDLVQHYFAANNEQVMVKMINHVNAESIHQIIQQ